MCKKGRPTTGQANVVEDNELLNSTDKQHRSILFVSSGMGGGKSRVLTELHGIIAPVLGAENLLIELRVNFENATSVQEHERSTARVVHKALLDRIMFHLLRKGQESLSAFISKKQIWGFDLAELVTAIQTHMKAALEKDNVFVLVSVDGAHHMDQKSGTYTDERIYSAQRQQWYFDSALREVFRVLHMAMMTVPCVMCAVSSTVTLPLEAVISKSDVLLKALIRPPALTSLPDEIQNPTVLEHKEHFVALFGEHPRTMEFLLNIRNTERVPEIMDACAEELLTRYEAAVKLSPTELNDLLRYSLSATCTPTSPVGDRVVDDVLSPGLLTLTDKTLHISPVLMYALWRTRTEFPILEYWEPFYNDAGARGFARFIGYVQCVRSQLFSGEVPLEELLHGVRWCTEPKSTAKVKPVPLTFVRAKHRVHTSSKKYAATLSDHRTKEEGPHQQAY